jgi:hypothetical protein
MPYKTKEQKLAAARRYRRAHPEKATAWCMKWQRANREKKNALNRKSTGEPGSAKRAAYNERRRLRRKQGFLAELQRARQFKESLREFITRKAA